MTKRTLYEVLGVEPTADTPAIRSAYRRLVLKYHPDRTTEEGASERFIEVTQAYEVLSDVQRRIEYDRMLEAKRRGATAPEPSRQQSASWRFADRPVVTVDPAVMHRLRTLMNQGRFGEAEREAQRIVAMHPRSAEAYAVLGDVAAARGLSRKAAEHYAMAAQMDPNNTRYLRLHEAMLAGLGPLRQTGLRDDDGNVPGAVLVGGTLVGLCGAYLASSPERPLFPEIGPISTWTVGLIVMLFVSGLIVGVALTLGRLLERFESVTSSASMRVAPIMALTGIAVFSFVLAAIVYVALATSQDAFNRTTSRLMAGVVLSTMLLGLLASIPGRVDTNQVLLWGGNLCFVGAVLGWMVADGFRKA